MQIQRLVFVAGLLCVLTACQSGQQPSAGMKADKMPDTPVSGAVLRHMHMHAAQLERLNAALRAGDLDAAGTPAYWLSRHETVPGMPKSWGPYVRKMRAEAQAVESATDLTTARAAADRLADSCRACHKANGRNVPL